MKLCECVNAITYVCAQDVFAASLAMIYAIGPPVGAFASYRFSLFSMERGERERASNNLAHPWR